jgi:glycosyltransferase involved in cell wall biosynthesis
MAALEDLDVTFIGHPFAPIGMGEQLRSHLAACARLHLNYAVYDIFRFAQRNDPAHFAVVGKRERESVPRGIRVFHVNGDEVDNVIAAFEKRGNSFADGHNIIVPAWELPTYPQVWAAKLALFDEVWALSDFIEAALAAAGVASRRIGQSVETEPMAFLPRRFFGIRESSFVLLHFFDLSSYASRKNPLAVLDLARRLRAEQPFLDLQLVLKVKNGEAGAEAWAAELRGEPWIRLIDAPLDSVATRSLVNACDCFVSLHRSEGFGRGLGEAMALGRLALGTGWSGNMDFMTAANSLLVRHALVDLRPDEYPHWQGQLWAEPDLEQACDLLRPVLADPDRGRAIAERGQLDVLRSHGHRAVGLRIHARLEEIAATSAKLPAAGGGASPTGLAAPPRAASRRKRGGAPAVASAL